MEALRAVCDAFVPALREADDPDGFWARSASDTGVPEAIADLLASLSPDEQQAFGRLLDLLASPALGFTWMGPLRPVTALTAAQRERMLQRWAKHPVGLIRRGFVGLKKLTGMLHYALAEPDAPNPNWATIGYPGPGPAPDGPMPARLAVLAPEREAAYTCDTIVVGSGAGGGVVAGELAEAGHDVIVIEKGPYLDRADFDGIEARAMDRLYEHRGALTTADGAISVMAGACLGGGTTINWAGAFRTPDYVLDEWADEHGLDFVRSPDFEAAFEALESAMDIGPERGPDNPQNARLHEGARALGLHVAPIPRNTTTPASEAEWKALGFSPFGDRYGTKRSVLETYLRRAAAHGARMLPDTEVERVLIESGRAVGVEAVRRTDAGVVRVTIRAERVVVAAGAIHTPALLRRSGIAHDHLGRHLYLHPTVSVAARYAEPIDPWHGPMMSVVSNAFTHLTGDYGPKLETPPVHAGILGLALPWTGGRDHKATMRDARFVGAHIVLTRDRDGGHVALDARGRPVLHYRISRFDRAHLLRGVAESARIHLAAGAEAVHFPHHEGPVLRREDDAEAFLARLGRMNWGPNRLALFSAHQMGTCRMGGEAARYPVAPDGRVRGTSGLYVADASLFPSASGANPMLSIQALAFMTAQHVKAASRHTSSRASVST